MFQIGQQVLYGIHGVCTISAIESKRFGKTKTDYYTLQPLAQPDSRYYIPVAGPTAQAKLRPLLSREELNMLLHSEESRQNIWIQEENQRRVRFREILAEADRSLVLSMIYCLQKHRTEQQKMGRKFHQADENFLRDAQKLIEGEFSHTLGITPGEVGPYIISLWEKTES